MATPSPLIKLTLPSPEEYRKRKVALISGTSSSSIRSCGHRHGLDMAAMSIGAWPAHFVIQIPHRTILVEPLFIVFNAGVTGQDGSYL